jgi:hypothetical protein
MEAMKDVVEYNGMLLHYKMEMPYKEFCERNVQLETRVAWDETTSEAMDAYYYCKERLEREAMRQ